MVRSRFWWFGGNSFYATTELTVFSFINESKTILGKCLWYGLVVFFICLTAYNAAKLTKLYLSGPTKTFARVATNIEDLALPNFTLSFTLPLDIFANGLPIAVPHLMKDTVCANAVPGVVKKRIRDQEHNVLAGKYLGSTDKLRILMKQFRNQTYPSSERYHEDIMGDRLWNEYYTISDLLHMYRQTAFKSWKPTQLKQQANNLRETLARLEPNKDNANVFLLLLMLQNRTGQSSAIYDNLFKDREVKMDSKRLLDTTHKVLNEIILLQPGQEDDARFFLRDWTLDSGKQRQTFTFHATLNKKKNHVVVNVFLMKLVHFLITITHLTQHIEILKNTWIFKNLDDPIYSHFAYELFDQCKQSKTRCEPGASHLWLREKLGWSQDPIDHIKTVNKAAEIRARALETHTIMELFQHYQDSTSITVEMFQNKIYALPFHENHIIIFPTGRFRVRTADCHNETALDCIDNCIGEMHLQKCNCYPWTLDYLYNGTAKPMCASACDTTSDSRELCTVNCQKKRNCDSQITKIQESKFKIEHGQWSEFYDLVERDYNSSAMLSLKLKYNEFNIDYTLPFSQLNIHLPYDSHYPVYTETYTMNFNIFLSQLSGILEFWLSINVAGMTHLLLYVLRQAYRMLDPASKTHQAWRNVFQTSQICTKKLDELLEMKRKNYEIIAKCMESQEDLSSSRNTKKEDGRWSWLFGNEFYKETWLTGFFYIDIAKSKAEALLWYTMISVFLVLTLQNIWKSYKDFQQKPTTTTIRMDSSVEHMDNVTVKLRMSWLEFQGNLPFIFSPTGYPYEYMEPENLICEQADPQFQQSKIDDLLGDITCTLAEYYYLGDHASALPENFYEELCRSPRTSLLDQIEDFLKMDNSTRTQNLLTDQWNTALIPGTRKQLQEFWTAHRRWEKDVITKTSTQQYNGETFGKSSESSSVPKVWADILYNITESMKSETVAKAQKDIIPLLMVFELIEADNEPAIFAKLQENDVTDFFNELTYKFYIPKMMQLQWLLPSFNLSKFAWADHLLTNPYHRKLIDANVSLSSLMKFVHSLIFELLPIKTDGLTTEATLQQATLIANKQVQLEYQISTHGQNLETVKLEIYSFELMRYLTLMQSLMEHISVQKRNEATGKCNDFCLQQLYCNKHGLWFMTALNQDLELEVSGDKIATIIDFTQREISGDKNIYGNGWEHVFFDHELSIYAIYKRAISQVLKHYQQTTTVQLKTAAGDWEFEPFKHHKITLLPSSSFQSHKTECYKGTVNDCIQHCQLDAYIRNCGCHPWHLHHIANTDEEICAKSCLPAKEAQEECTANCLEPCSIWLHRKQQLSAPIQHTEWAIDKEFGFEKLFMKPSLPLATFEIGLQKLQHPKLTETYAISTSAFVAQLGNLMELWLGFNIVALVHLMIFFTRKIIYAALSKKERENHSAGGADLDSIEQQDETLDDFHVIRLKHERIMTQWKEAQERLNE